jgi:serine/threonine protein kinase
MSRSVLPRPLGRYTLLRRLATGGMAEVYLAKMAGVAGFEKNVAIKRLHPFRATGAAAGSGLIDEAKISVALTHPNIVRTFDLGRDDGAEFIVMEHVEGHDAQHVLDSLRSRGACFPIDLAAHVMAQVCRGLDHAHRHEDDAGRPASIIHRDVSPQNILLSFAGEVKIADFGIAQTNETRSDPGAPVIKGKYFYMSPEQTRAERLDGRSDVFSAGVVLWELLCGRRPFDAPDVRTLLQRIRRAEVVPPSALRPRVPTALDMVVARATRREPDARFESAGAMADALDEYLVGRPPVRAPRAISMLLGQVAPRTLVPVPPSPVGLPQTRDRVVTLSAFDRATVGEPPLRHELDEGEPTLAGTRSVRAASVDYRWLLTLALGAALVCLAAWSLRGP